MAAEENGMLVVVPELNVMRSFSHERRRSLETVGYWGDANYIYFVSKEDRSGYMVELTEELYRAILSAIKRSPPAARSAAKRASQKGIFGSRNYAWSDPEQITKAAEYAEIDVRQIIVELSRDKMESEEGRGSDDDGIIYILRHLKHPIVKIGKTRGSAASRATNYTLDHADPDGWIVHHEVNTKSVSAVEARIHTRLSQHRAAYGYNAKEVFAVSVSAALKAVYIEVEF